MKSSRKGGFSSSVLLTCLCNLCNLLSQQDLCVPPDSSYLCNSCYFHRLVLKHLFLHHSLVLKHLFLHLLWYSFCFFLTFFFFFFFSFHSVLHSIILPLSFPFLYHKVMLHHFCLHSLLSFGAVRTSLFLLCLCLKQTNKKLKTR